MKSFSLKIAYQCPQCGAPAELSETDRLFTCDYCRVRSYLLPQKFFRYRLPLGAPARDGLVYFPYWRFKGMLFSAGPGGIQHRFIDISQQACPNPAFPASLGFRTQALQLRFVLPDTPGYFIRPSVPMENLTTLCASRWGWQQAPVQAQIGESVSLIYAPFYVGKKLVDGVLDRPLGVLLPDSFNMDEMPGGGPEGRIDFISAVCPKCAWDLEGARNALVLICRHCRTVWLPTAAGLRNINCVHAAGVSGSRYLPFWRITAEFKGQASPLPAALMQARNGPRGVSDESRPHQFRFWVPAFKLRPDRFLRVARQLTVSQPREKWIREVPPEACYPVTLPIGEAAESLPIHLANLLSSRSGHAPTPQGLDIIATSYLLAYLPFDETAHELVQPTHHIAINRNTLALADNL